MNQFIHQMASKKEDQKAANKGKPGGLRASDRPSSGLRLNNQSSAVTKNSSFSDKQIEKP